MKTKTQLANEPAFPFDIAVVNAKGLNKFEYFAGKFTASSIASGDGVEDAIIRGIKGAQIFLKELASFDQGDKTPSLTEQLEAIKDVAKTAIRNAVDEAPGKNITVMTYFSEGRELNQEQTNSTITQTIRTLHGFEDYYLVGLHLHPQTKQIIVTSASENGLAQNSYLQEIPTEDLTKIVDFLGREPEEKFALYVQ